MHVGLKLAPGTVFNNSIFIWRFPEGLTAMRRLSRSLLAVYCRVSAKTTLHGAHMQALRAFLPIHLALLQIVRKANPVIFGGRCNATQLQKIMWNSYKGSIVALAFPFSLSTLTPKFLCWWFTCVAACLSGSFGLRWHADRSRLKQWKHFWRLGTLFESCIQGPPRGCTLDSFSRFLSQYAKQLPIC